MGQMEVQKSAPIRAICGQNFPRRLFVSFVSFVVSPHPSLRLIRLRRDVDKRFAVRDD